MINSFNWFNLSTKSLTAIAMAALHDEGLLDYETRFSFFVIDWLTTFIGPFPFSESNGPWLSISEKASAWLQVVFLFGNENRGHVNKPPCSDQEYKCYMLFPIQDHRLLAGIWSKRQGDNDSGRSYETWGDASFWAAYFMIVKTFEEPKSSRISIHLCIFCEAWQHISEGRITQRGTHGSRGLSQGEHQAEQGQTSSRTRPNIQRIQLKFKRTSRWERS